MTTPLHIVDKPPVSQREPGMMWRYPPGDVDGRECWWIILPKDDRVGTPGHVSEVDWRTTDKACDGSGMWSVTGEAPNLTVTPSIDVECWVMRDGKPEREGSYWHGWITNGELDPS
jgi:hypothetical protein